MSCEFQIDRKMGITEVLLKAFLLLGILQISLSSTPDNMENEEPEGDADASCQKIIQDASSNYRNCLKPYIESEEFRNAMWNSNGSMCAECLLWCRDNFFIEKCLKESLSHSYPCLNKINHIPQSFFMDLLDSFVEFACDNDAEVLREAFSVNMSNSEERQCGRRIQKCDRKGLSTYFSSNATTNAEIEYSEKGFCRTIMETLHCATHEVKDCSERIGQGINRVIAHIRNSTSCSALLEERQIEDVEHNTSGAN